MMLAEALMMNGDGGMAANQERLDSLLRRSLPSAASLPSDL
jgi:hypothetical protein